MFVLLTGDTEAGLRKPGRFASHEEAGFIWWGIPAPSDTFVFQKGSEIPPAVFTRAARLVSDFPVLIVRAGTFTHPVCPFMETGAQPGKNPRKEKAVPDARRLWDCGFSIGRLVARMGETVVIGESVPGGDVTADLLLRAFGMPPVDPDNESAWEDASSRLGITPKDLPGRGFEAVVELGDPMQVVAAGIATGARDRAEVVLAGGIPMLAVAALLRNLGDIGRITIATTSRTVDDPSLDFCSMAASLGLESMVIPLDYVRDGAGAAGAAWYAERLDFTLERVLQRAALLCGELSAAPTVNTEG
ncbi:MAG: nicotinate-nucleotide--dimethylbenzimidazole phosphoribosyltransferase [Thermovirgaceae bacterium]|nr:nicotinate-nucleotide--dimethylbenzimidazole phosphoribosyltransferase [Thermovirgaceae bacterium]